MNREAICIECVRTNGVRCVLVLATKVCLPTIQGAPIALHIDVNQLDTLPLSIGQLTELRHLGVRNNKLTTLSELIGGLRKLDTINVHDGQLSEQELSRIKAALPHIKINSVPYNWGSRGFRHLTMRRMKKMSGKRRRSRA